jgi:hypothetical protein
MNDTHQQYLELIRRTRRCRTEVLETAGKMAGVGPGIMADLARQLIENGEDTALGLLTNVCSHQGIQLPPSLLPAVLEVIEPITDFGPLSH